MTNKAINSKNTNKKRSVWDFGMTSVLIFFLFRIPISNILGNEGNGYLAVTWEIYVVLSIFLGGCIGKTIVQMVKLRCMKHQYHNSTKILKVSLAVGFLIAVLGAVIIYFLSDKLTRSLFYMKLSSVSLRFASILLIFNVMVNIFRGYFEGTGTKVPTYFSQIIEVLVSGTAACIFSFLLSKYGKKVGALLFDTQYEPAFGGLGVILACILGSVIALLFLIIVNAIYQKPLTELYRKDETHILDSNSNIIIELLKMSVITILSTLSYKGYRFINIGIYIRNNISEGLDLKVIQQIGSYHGRILVLLSILVVLVIGFTGKNYKRIYSCYQKNNYTSCKRYLMEDIKYILIFSFSGMFLFILGAKKILQIIFQSATQAEVTMLQIGTAGVVFSALAYYLYRILCTIKRNYITWIILLIGFIAQILIMFIVVKIPSLGILSLIITEVFFVFVIFCLESIAVFGILKDFKFPIIKKSL